MKNILLIQPIDSITWTELKRDTKDNLELYIKENKMYDKPERFMICLIEHSYSGNREIEKKKL